MGDAPRQCRGCEAVLREIFLDLGASPLANSFLRPDALQRPETFYPLTVYVCHECFLVQLPEFESPAAIFSDYAYFSSYSDTWLKHAEAFAERMMDRLPHDRRSLVIEVASNDGYLLQFFARRGVAVLGVEPAQNVAAAARTAGIPTLVEFFGRAVACRLAEEGQQADLLVGNNVLAHVPDLDDFVAGLKLALKPAGLLTLEFPHLMRLMAENQFDTIYHEHFTYFSFLTARRVLARHRLVVTDVEELPTHGGSLRVYARHAEDSSKVVSARVTELADREAAAGFTRLEHYRSFGARVQETKRELLEFLIAVKGQGKSIVGYGAPAKGNTLLNYCGIRSDFLDYTVDRSLHKQGLFLPGTRIPIHGPERIRETKPDYLLILPWNLKDEIMDQMACIREWGGQFVVPVPRTKVYR